MNRESLRLRATCVYAYIEISELKFRRMLDRGHGSILDGHNIMHIVSLKTDRWFVVT